MKKKIISITIVALVCGSIGIVLANNKAKIDKAAKPIKENPVIPVKAHEVKEDSFNTSFHINGSTVPAKEVSIASEVTGKLVALHMENGDIVRTGQVLATLDASTFGAQMNSIDASLAKANLDLARYTKLVDMGGATPMQVESVRLQISSLHAEKKQVLEAMSHMQIRAPFGGKLENVKVELGSYLSYGTVLGQLIDNSNLKIEVFLSEREAFKVRLGQAVEINSVVLSQPKNGKITMISDKADNSGKFLTEISFSNKDKEALKAGILAEVYFPMQATEKGLSIPVSALVGSASQAKVFVVKGDKVEQRQIKTGIVTVDKVQVVEGLQAGDRVVISGQLNLVNGTPISINK